MEYKELLKIDKNGSKHYRGIVACDRCGGAGGSDAWKYTGWTCYKCGGSGKMEATWIERTPEYEAKLAERRAKKAAKIAAEQAEKIAEYERAQELARQEKEREEARIKAQKAISQYVGEIGQKIEIEACFDHSAWFTTHIGWKEETMFVHTFKTVEGNVLVWKTQRGLDFNYGEPVKIRGTVKDHSEYKDEKQTALLRCKIERIQPENI